MTDSLSLSLSLSRLFLFFVVVDIFDLSDTLYKLMHMIIATVVVNFKISILHF